MVYLDTSFILPLFVREKASEQVAAMLQQIPSEEMTISSWTKTEFVSALARRVRMREISSEMAETAIVYFAETLENSCTLLLPNQEDFETAISLLRDFKSGLRAGDALHLALVLNYKMDALYTLDNGFAVVAKNLNIVVKSC